MILAMWMPGVRAADQPRGGLVIELRPHALVSGSRYTLGDVATIKGVAEDEQTVLARTVLGEIDDVGKFHGFSAAAVRAQLHRTMPAEADTGHWRGAPVVKIMNRGDALPAAALIEHARTFLIDTLRTEAGAASDLRIQAVGRVDEVTMPHGKLTLRARPSEGGLAARMCVWVDVLVDGEPVLSRPIWFRVRLYRDVLVAGRSLPLHEIPAASDVETVRRDIAAEPDALTSRDPLGQLRLRQPVVKGETIRRAQLEGVPLIAKDESVKVMLNDGLIRIVTQGIAARDGHAGDLIEVSNPGSGGRYSVRVGADGVGVVVSR